MTTQRECVSEGDPRALETVAFGRSSRRIAQRDARIVASRARGKSWPAIAQEKPPREVLAGSIHDLVALRRDEALGVVAEDLQRLGVRLAHGPNSTRRFSATRRRSSRAAAVPGGGNVVPGVS